MTRWPFDGPIRDSLTAAVMVFEARIGEQLRAAQGRGEVAARGDNPNVRASDNQTATFPKIGITGQRAAEYKALHAPASGHVVAAVDGVRCPESRVTAPATAPQNPTDSR